MDALRQYEQRIFNLESYPKLPATESFIKKTTKESGIPVPSGDALHTIALEVMSYRNCLEVDFPNKRNPKRIALLKTHVQSACINLFIERICQKERIAFPKDIEQAVIAFKILKFVQTHKIHPLNRVHLIKMYTIELLTQNKVPTDVTSSHNEVAALMPIVSRMTTNSGTQTRLFSPQEIARSTIDFKVITPRF